MTNRVVASKNKSIKPKKSGIMHRIAFVNFLMTVGSLVICLVIANISIVPQTYDITEGGVAPQSITSPYTVTDEISTQRKIDEAQAKVGPVYKRDADISQQIVNKVGEDFLAFEEGQRYAEEVYDTYQQQQLDAAQQAIDDAAAARAAQQAAADAQAEANSPDASATPETTPEPQPEPTAYVIQPLQPETTDWAAMLSDENMAHLAETLPAYMNEEDIYALLSMTQAQLKELQNVTSSETESVVYAGIDSDKVEEAKSALQTMITGQVPLSEPQQNLLYKLLANDIHQNMVFDEEATQAAKDDVAKTVSPVEYQEGQNIVVKGEIVTSEQYAVLKDLGLLSTETASIAPYVAVSAYITMLFVLYALFLALFNQKLLLDVKKVAILSILTAAAYGVTAIAQLVAVHIYPVFLFVILGAVLLSPKNAIVYSVFLSTLLMSVTTGTQSLLSVESLIILLTTLLGSFFAIFAIKDMRYRSRLALAGILAALPGLVIEFIAWAFKVINAEQLLQIYGMILLSGFLCGIASIGVIPLIENAFRLITPTKLLELSAPDHPLLKRLMFEAPGTYHHSMLVANLAEAACDAVGGFSLLARVGGYFHDVGKLENPKYFKENQNSKNPHDDLPPKESSRIIRKHVPDGIALLKKHNMPKEIQAIVLQHHGNSLVKFFYHKAQQEGGEVNISDYRYGGVPPSTKESAIIMLGDIVEAAVRSMDSPSREEISAQVEKLIKACYDEGQLDNAPLNRQELNKIKEAFINIFDGVYSTRIKYPEIKFHGVEDGDNVI